MGKVIEFGAAKARIGLITSGEYAGLYRHQATLTGTDALLSALEAAENVMYEVVDEGAVPENIRMEATGALDVIGAARSGSLSVSIIDDEPGK
jgi:hypothetical protein